MIYIKLTHLDHLLSKDPHDGGQVLVHDRGVRVGLCPRDPQLTLADLEEMSFKPENDQLDKTSNILQGRSSLVGHLFLQALHRHLNQKFLRSFSLLSSSSSS